MSDLYKTIQALEISLHQPDVRGDKNRLATLLHPNFTEIGYAGKTWHYDSILNSLEAEQAEGRGSEIWSQNYEYVALTTNLIQVIYNSANIENGVLCRYSKRSSIWVADSGSWKMQFHQATPTGPFEKTVSPNHLIR